MEPSVTAEIKVISISGNSYTIDLEEKQIASVVSDVISNTCLDKFEYRGHPFATEKMLATYPVSLDPKKYPNTWELVLTGSSAEFYIRPIVLCMNDVDAMISHGNILTVDADNPHFTPIGDISDETVNVYELEYLQKFPAYVRLHQIGDFVYNWKIEEYDFQVCRPTIICRVDNETWHETRNIKQRAGPAINYREKYPLPSKTHLQGILPECDHHPTVDGVTCHRCNFWPNVAEEWKHRLRENGWPSKSMVLNIVANGCDVVCVSHPHIREDKSVNRLSFSRAEVILIRSWSHVQQVVYHMLRYFAKEELINPSWESENKILCTYHVKTLMLWACETERKDFWEGKVINICCILLEKLKDSLKRKFLPNYFVRQCNLYDHIRNEANRQQVIETVEIYQVSHVIGRWFHDHYIMKSQILRHWEVMYIEFSSEAEGMNKALYSRMVQHDCALLLNGVYIRQSSPSPIYNRKKASADYGHWFAEHITAMQLLLLVKGLKGKILFDTVGLQIYERIATLYKRFEVHSLPATYKQHLSQSRLHFIIAQELMTGLSGQNSPCEFRLITNLSIECFQKYLYISKSVSDLRFFCASFVYLAAMHLIRGENSVAAYLCSELINEIHLDRNKKHVQHDSYESAVERQLRAIVGFLISRQFRISCLTSTQKSIAKLIEEHNQVIENQRKAKYGICETINGRLLLFIDDVANILGFLALYRCINGCSAVRLSQRLSPSWTNFTPNIIARYLLNLSKTEDDRSASNHIAPSSTVADRCLMVLSEPRKNLFHRKKKAEEEEESCPPCHSRQSESFEDIFIQHLMNVYFEKLTIAFDMLRNDAGADCVEDFVLRALYSFRCKKYDLVLSLCDQLDVKIVRPDQHLACTICHLTFASSTDPPVDIFLDDDIRSVFGLHRLLQTIYGIEEEDYFYFCRRLGDEEDVSELSSASKSERIRKVSRSFLAKYLRIRCLMETNRSLKEIVVAYRSLKETLKNGLSYDHSVFVLVRRRLKLIINDAQQVQGTSIA